MKNSDKFDVVIGNPPYQSSSGNKGAGNILWDKFVKLSIDLTKDKGYVCLIHPSLWRKPRHKLWESFSNNNLLYLNINNESEGMRVFGANTRFDWYVLQKSDYSNITVINTENNKTKKINIQEWGWLPNFDFDLIESLLAKDNEEKCEVINSQSSYEPRKNWMNKTKTKKFKYPCVYSVNRKNQVTLKWSSTNKNGHFGIPKVIFGSGATGFYVDRNGEYGMTQWASGIVDRKSVLPSIAKSLNSEEFKQVIRATAMSKAEININVLRYFRKDFWKEFI